MTRQTATSPSAWSVDRGSADVLTRCVRDIPDHPEPGIVFKDITPLLSDARAFRTAVDAFAALCRDRGATKVAGLEARGFILGAPAAATAGIGFVPLRKAGKLPGPTLGREYALEYGRATLEIHTDALSPADRVVVIDDVLATGGTLGAALDLIRAAGGTVVTAAVLMELSALKGRDRLEPELAGVPLESLITV